MPMVLSSIQLVVIKLKNSFIQDENGNWYYFDKRGYLVTGAHEIDGKHVYFLKNGIQLRDSIREDENGNQYYYDQTGAQVLNRYYTTDGQNWRYFDAKGVMARGLVKIGDGQQFFDENGYQEMLLSIVLLKVITQVIGTISEQMELQ